MKVQSKTYSNYGNNAVLNFVSASSKYILDIGCGAGDNAKILSESAKIIDGITISSKEAEIASKHCRFVFNKNLEEGLPFEVFDNVYDTIICSHVLEHIAYPESLLKDIHKYLQLNGGKVIIALPNFMHYRYRIKMLFGEFNYTEAGVMDYTHLRWYTYKSAKQLFIKHGFVIEKSIADISLPFNRILKFLPTKMKSLLKFFLLKISPGFFGSQIIFTLVVTR